MKKRLFSLFLAFSLCLTLLPASALPALATGAGGEGEGGTASTAVTYTREKPEVAIFNAYSSKSASLYDAAKGTWIYNTSPYIQYNAVKYFWNYDGSGSNGIWGDYDTWASTATWKWRGLAGNATGDAVPFRDTTLYALTQPYGNLKVNLSMTSLNYVHNHSANKVIYTDVKQVTRVGEAELVLGGARTYVNGSMSQSDVSSKPRIGDLTSDTENLTTLYHGNSYVGNDGYIQFSSPTVDYDLNGTQTCDCAGAYSTNVMVTFVDDRAPVLTGLWLSKDGGETKVRHMGQREDLQVGAGETLTIIYQYDEPIRFSDDSAAGKENLYISLMAQGKDEGTYRAYLTKLDGDCLYFEYKNDTQDAQDTILAMNMDSLFAATTIPGVSSTEIPLHQVYGENSFQPASSYKIKDSNSTLGISTSACWITDLAGNPIPRDNASSVSLRIDSKAPTVAAGGVAFELALNNDDVKAALGKTDLDPSDDDYTDNSDLFLGAGDSLRLIVTMSECLNVERQTKAVATTNIKVTDACLSSMNSYLQEKYKYTTNDGGYLEIPLFAAGVPSQDRATQFYQQFTFEINDGMSLPAGETQIKVTKLVINGEAGAKDLAGNAYDPDPAKSLPADAHNNPPQLDVTPAVATAITGSYAPYDTTGFRYGMTLSDVGSGFAGLTGTFVLNSASAAKATYRYEYCVKAGLVDTDNNPIVPADGDWQTAILGEEVPFEQTEQVYIYIRPASGETYAELAECSLTVKPKDLAGNVGSSRLPDSGSLDWYIDNLPPTVAVAGSSRTLNANSTTEGTLKVELTLTDTHGISEWKYGWSSDKSQQPDTWTTGSGTSLTEAVTDAKPFSGHLWVVATDNAGAAGQGNSNNPSDPCYLGYFSYDITPVKYTLNYSPKVQSPATVGLAELDANGTVIFMIPSGTEGGYWVRMYQNGTDTPDANQPTDNIFGAQWIDGWMYRTVTVNDGVYTFATPGTADNGDNVARKLQSQAYTGDVQITVLSGQTAGLTSLNGQLGGTDTYYYPQTAGNESYKFTAETITVRAIGKDTQYLAGTSITSGETLDYFSKSETWDGSDGKTLLSTLSGVKFSVNVGTDNLGWDYANVDWSNSKVVVEQVTLAANTGGATESNQYTEVASVPLTPRVQTQTVALPVQSYASGIYRVRLHIAVVAGDGYDVIFGTYIAVDATAADNDFTLTSATYQLQEENAYRNAYGVLKEHSVDGGQTEVFYENTRDCLAGSTVLLPISSGDGGEYLGTSQKHTLTFTSGGAEGARTKVTVGGEGTEESGYSSYFGQFYWAIWDTANADKVIKLQSATAAQNTLTVEDLFVFKNTAGADKLYLEPNKTHTVAVQKVYANGEKSVVKEFMVTSVDRNLDGDVSIDAEAGQLVFTPDEAGKTANLSAGATVYAWTYQRENENTQGGSNPDDKHYVRGNGTPQRMTLAGDGSWRCNLPEGGAIYRVVTITADGCVNVVGEAGLRQLAPRFTEDTLTLTAAGGAYSMGGDDSGDWIWIYDEDPDKLSLTVTATDTNGVSQTVTLSLSDMTSVTSTNGLPTYEWIPTAANALGLWYVKVQVDKDSDISQSNLRILRLQGNCPKDGATLTVTATDSIGQSTSLSASLSGAAADDPTVTGELIFRGDDLAHYGGGLKLTFSQAVRPAESWAWVASDEPEGYHTEWVGAFPITRDGTYTIEYYDVYGRLRTQEITLSGVFKSGSSVLGADISFSETEPTARDVGVTVNCTSNYFTWNDSTTYLEGEQTYTVTDNGVVTVTFQGSGGYTLTIYVNNIAKGAPTAQVRYYVNTLGREFSAEELAAYIASMGGSLTVEGNVQATYVSSRKVTPTGGTGTQFVFTPGGATSHTFTFEDTFPVEGVEKTGSVTARLPAGLTLTEKQNAPADTTAPTVSVDIYGMRAGTYTARSSFRAGDTDIADKFEQAGYVQAYSLTVNADDASGFDITVTDVEGVTLTGNIVTVTKAAAFTITVTDRAATPNKTEINITADMVKKLDNTAPTATVAVDPSSTDAKQILKITLTDKDDAGSSTGSDAVTVLTPTGVTKDSSGWRYEATQNVDITFTFVDQAGNTGSATYTVSGIDTSAPHGTVYWSPSEGGTYNATTRRVEGGTLPSTKVNTSVTAVIKFDKPVDYISIADYDGNKIKPFSKDDDPVIKDTDGKELVRFTATADQLTVTYLENYPYELTVSVTGMNGKKGECILPAVTIIDKVQPDFTATPTPVCRTGYTEPYAMKVTLQPVNNGKEIAFPRYGERISDGKGGRQSKFYTWAEPLTVTFTENGTYSIQAMDAAGNVVTKSVTVSGIDRTAPEIKVENQNMGTGYVLTADITVNENCTVTIQGKDRNQDRTVEFTKDAKQTITFMENDSYRITATDKAGNSSSRVVVVKGLDKLAPTISFTGNTVYVLQGSSATALEALLGVGTYTVWDNKEDTGYPTVTYDSSRVDLNADGLYTVTYTVKDRAGNTTVATRLVKVIGSATVCARIDSSLILPNRTAVLTPGEHTLTLEHCNEPYTVKARKGIYSLGQMKYLSGNSLSFTEVTTGVSKFTVTDTGYYTLLITTQSRQTIRILLYVEQ